ncbi:MAG: DUF84 family protein [Alphaproteobacteria bacterium]|nr:DUF84 family protein [Alphaproteobacteria bacterium]
MKIVLASQSPVKMEAIKRAFAHVAGVEFEFVKAPSGINEQPEGYETLAGAYNRIENVQIAFAKAAHPGADLYITIESGIFLENNKWVDRALVMFVTNQGMTRKLHSAGVVFNPTPAHDACIEEARKRGFDTWTVGKVMQERGLVDDHADPHKDLPAKGQGRSRVEFIDDTLRQVIAMLPPGFLAP